MNGRNIQLKGFLESVDFRAYSMLGALFAVWAYFHFATDGIFFSPVNLSNLMSQTAVTGILAVAMLMVIVSGNIDLSVGSVLGLAGAVAGILMTKLEQGMPVAVSAALMVSVAIGALHGTLVSYLRIPSFIVTLGGLLAWRGAVKWIAGSETVQVFDKGFLTVGNQFLDPRAGWLLGAVAAVLAGAAYLRARKLDAAGRSPNPVEASKFVVRVVAIVAFVHYMNSYAGIPIAVTVMFLVAACVGFIANQTVFGRRLYAIGGNVEAARLSGINERSTVLKVYVLLGLLTGIAALIFTARLGSATLDAGTLKELDAIAACVIGGASLAGGRGTVFGALVGALIMASLDNGMGLLGVGAFKQEMVKGLILVSAVGSDVVWNKTR